MPPHPRTRARSPHHCARQQMKRTRGCGVRPHQYLPRRPTWPVTLVFQRMAPQGHLCLDFLWRSQLPQEPVRFPGHRAMKRLPRYKVRHPRKSSPRRRLHRHQYQRQAASPPVALGARDPHRHAERIAPRRAGVPARGAVAVESPQRSRAPLPAGLGLSRSHHLQQKLKSHLLNPWNRGTRAPRPQSQMR